jgi:hypothetical protein
VLTEETAFMQLAAVPGVTIYGPPPARGRAALASFNVDNLHATDISTALNDFHGEIYCNMSVLHQPHVSGDLIEVLCLRVMTVSVTPLPL